jgi:hypothetical protein
VYIPGHFYRFLQANPVVAGVSLVDPPWGLYRKEVFVEKDVGTLRILIAYIC